MRKLIQLAFFLLLALPLQAARTFYIANGGSDAANGTSTSTPWAHSPGMVGCANTCASTTPTGDDTFIFKGGDTWANAVFPITWEWSGTSGHPITMTVDATWYTGGAWTRPIFTAGGTLISTHNNFIRFYGAEGSYTVINNIEFTNYTWVDAAYGEASFICSGACSGGSVANVSITNNYFHNWSHGTATGDDLKILLGSSNSPWMSGSLVDSNVFDNSDGDHVSGMVLYCWSGTITKNYINAAANGILPMGTGGTVSGNTLNIVASFDAAQHENAIETLGGTTPTWYIHDNRISGSTGGESMLIGNDGETDYVWNNLTYNWSQNAFHFGGSAATGLYFWNNTVIPLAGNDCFVNIASGTITTLAIQNNHCITTAAVHGTLTGVTTLVEDHNVLQTPTAATAQGYTSSQTPYVYFPTAGGSTIGAGANLSAHCSGALASLCSDTSYGVTLNSSNHTVVSPARTVVARGTAFDAGAYQYGSAPSPPTNVRVSSSSGWSSW